MPVARIIDRFAGHILGVGSTSSVRVVVGLWRGSPLGPFADVMVATGQDRRVLLAPSAEVADYVSATYHFDEVVRCPVLVTEHEPGRPGWAWQVEAGPLRLTATIDGRTRTGRFLRLLPPVAASSRAVAVLGDPVARVLHPGVRTFGTAGNRRREYYGANDQHAVATISGAWHRQDLGQLAPVDPPPRFGFSSTPRTPSLTSVTTSISRPA